MMIPEENAPPFAWGWWGMDLGQSRPVQFTYERFAFDSLPPLPTLDGSLGWLGAEDMQNKGIAAQRRDIATQGWLAQLTHEAAQFGLTLPPAYVHFMSSSQLQDRIPEYAGSWFPLSENLVPCIGNTAGRLIRILMDQQEVVVWFLYLMPHGKEIVIGSLEGRIDAAQWVELYTDVTPTAEEIAQVNNDTLICAPSFESFIYRFWLESTIYNKVHGFNEGPLTIDEQRYLAYFKDS